MPAHTGQSPSPAHHSGFRMSGSVLVRSKATYVVFIFSALKQYCNKCLAICLCTQQALRWRGTSQVPRVPHRTFAVDSSTGKKLRVPDAREAPQSPGSLEFRPSWPLSALPETQCRVPAHGADSSRSTWLQDWSSAGPFPRNVSPGLASGVFPEAAPAPLTETRVGVMGLNTRCSQSRSDSAFGNFALGFLSPHHPMCFRLLVGIKKIEIHVEI